MKKLLLTLDDGTNYQVLRVSENQSHPAVREAISDAIARVNPGGIFANAIRSVRFLPQWLLLKVLARRSYDGLIFTFIDRPIAHIFWQRHGKDIHMFSVWVATELRGRSVAHECLRYFVAYFGQFDDIKRVRIGGGGVPAVCVLYKKLAANQPVVRNRIIVPGDDFWLNYVRIPTE